MRKSNQNFLAMKLCPSCNTQYTDDSLAYCLQDGTPLVSIVLPKGVTDSDAFRHRTEAVENGPPSQITQIVNPAHSSGSKTTIMITVLLIALIGVVIVIALGLAWLLSRPGPDATNKSGANDRNINSVINVNRPALPTPMLSPSPTSSVTIALPTPTPPTNTGDDMAIGQVEETIEKWREATNSLDSASLIGNYADTVDYYQRGPVSADFVLNDKKRAFDRFTTIRITISNTNIAVDPSGDRATAEFDKAWVFRGAREVKGKARSQLRFAKVAGKWLITGERDLKVYYTGK